MQSFRVAHPYAMSVAALLGPMVIVGTMVFALLYRREDIGELLVAEGVLAAALCLVSMGTFTAIVFSSELQLDERGIRRVILGKARFDIKWSEVKRIRIANAQYVVKMNGGQVHTYSIDKTLGFHFPLDMNAGILFMSDLPNIDALLAEINKQAAVHKFPIVDWRRR